MVHDPDESPLIAGAVLTVASSAQVSDHEGQVVESHVGWDMGIVGHDPEENLLIVGAAVVVGTI